MKSKKIIGVLGNIGSGKGTLGDILVEEGYMQLSFAGSLKDAVSVIFHWDRGLLEGDTEESRDFREQEDLFWSRKIGYKVTPRNILQKIGTDVLRDNFLSSIWIDSLERKMYDYDKIVVTDVRFNNEMEFIKSCNGKLIEVIRYLTRPEWYDKVLKLNKSMPHVEPDKCVQEVNLFMQSHYSDIHISEYGWIGSPCIDFVLENNGTKEEFKDSIKKLLTEFGL